MQINVSFFLKKSIFKIFCFILIAQVILLNDRLYANDSNKIMNKQVLRSKFTKIQKHPIIEERIKMFFTLSESLETEIRHKETHFRQDKNKAYFIDYIGLLKTLQIDQQIEILQYSVKKENAKYKGLYCYYLVHIGNINGLSCIHELKHSEVKLDIIGTLQYHNSPKVISVLSDILLNGESPEIRYAAASSLGIIKNKIAIPFLIAALYDNECTNFPSSGLIGNDYVAASAERALNKITGKNLSVKEWKTIDFNILLKE